MWLADQRDKRYFSLCQTVLARDEAHLGCLKSTRIHLCLNANGATVDKVTRGAADEGGVKRIDGFAAYGEIC